MKLMYDQCNASFEIEESLNESTGVAQKKYKIKGIFSTPDTKNRNGRIYPMSIWEVQVAKYQEELSKGSSNCLMELNHPSDGRTSVDMMEAVAKIDKVYIKNGLVMGEATLLDNPKANQLKSLIDVGITMAVSSRGVGSVGKNGLVESFKLVNWDLIPNQQQSDLNSEMKGIVEGILITEDFDIDENDNIVKVKVCGKNKCLLENRDSVNEAILSKFSMLLGEAETTDTTPTLSALIKKLSIQDVINILSLMVKKDNLIKVQELITVLKNQKDTSVLLTNEVIRQVYNDRLSKKSILNKEV